MGNKWTREDHQLAKDSGANPRVLIKWRRLYRTQGQQGNVVEPIVDMLQRAWEGREPRRGKDDPWSPDFAEGKTEDQIARARQQDWLKRHPGEKLPNWLEWRPWY